MGLISTGEVAKRLGVTPQTVREWIASKKIQASQTPGGHWRVDESLVRDLICSNQQSSLAKALE